MENVELALYPYDRREKDRCVLSSIRAFVISWGKTT
jgi:hypothetical protein